MNGLSDRSRFLLVTQPLRGHQALLASEFVKAYGGRSMAYETLEQVTLRRAILEVFEQERNSGIRHRELQVPAVLWGGLPVHVAFASEVLTRIRRTETGQLS